MNKAQISGVLLVALSFLLLPVVSAYHGYDRPSFSSSFGSDTSYRESPGFTYFPTESTRADRSRTLSDTNFDSSSLNYDYRGPLYERTIAYTDDFSKVRSDKSGFFSSRNKDTLRHRISSTLTEKYVGETQSLYSNNQNRRSITLKEEEKASNTYDGGFSFGKQRLFDQSEYAHDSYTTPYYYRPTYDPRGYYNWRY